MTKQNDRMVRLKIWQLEELDKLFPGEQRSKQVDNLLHLSLYRAELGIRQLVSNFERDSNKKRRKSGEANV